MKHIIYIMSYNIPHKTKYVYETLKNQGANVKVLENSSDHNLVFQCEDTIDLGRTNIGTGGFYTYVLENLSPEFDFYGVFNNDVFDISCNFMEEMINNLDIKNGIVHSLNKENFHHPYSKIKDDYPNYAHYYHLENIIPFFSYRLLNVYKSKLTKPIINEYYGLIDVILSNLSNELNLNIVLVKTCSFNHERGGIRKNVPGNFNDYQKNNLKTTDVFLKYNPELKKYNNPIKKKITFRKIKHMEDLSFVNHIRNGYCKEFLHDNRQFTVEQTIEWFEKTNPDWYIIEFENEPIGYFRLSNYSEENMNIYVGADIHTEHTGKGLGYLSYKEFLPFLFDEYGLNKVSLEVLSTNERAIHLYKKLGFIIEGVKRQEVLKKGVFIDSIIMSILRSELKWKI